jgi:hypothetical protein
MFFYSVDSRVRYGGQSCQFSAFWEHKVLTKERVRWLSHSRLRSTVWRGRYHPRPSQDGTSNWTRGARRVGEIPKNEESARQKRYILGLHNSKLLHPRLYTTGIQKTVHNTYSISSIACDRCPGCSRVHDRTCQRISTRGCIPDRRSVPQSRLH